MPPKKLPPSAAKQQKKPTPEQKSTASSKPKKPSSNANNQPAVSEQDVKQNASLSAQMALEAAKKAYDLRQAAYGAGDPNAREEILAKAINKEIEAESFGKAAKYTRSGAFQGLAAGAGLGVQPGVTLGKLTGALVGGVVSSVGALLGGGIGSAYGAISGPFWDLGQMASHGVRSIVGDFPNWEATSGQKKALEKMVMGVQKTPAPDQGELEEMRDDNGGASQEEYMQFYNDMKSYIPSMPSMPSMPSLSSIPGFGGGTKQASSGVKHNSTSKANQPQQQPYVDPNQQQQYKSAQHPKEEAKPKATPKPREPLQSTPNQPAQPQNTQSKEEPPPRKKPKKLEVRSGSNTPEAKASTTRKAPPKLESRKKPATASA